MRQDNYPHPVSDPEAEGLPGYADDDSHADAAGDATRIADGPDPAALPSDTPLGVDRYGTTAEEQRRGEPMDYKLAQEQPERHRTGPGTDEGDALTEDLDDIGDASIAPVQPNPDSPVSMYDVPDDMDRDVRAAHGGPSAEEAAMHEVREG